MQRLKKFVMLLLNVSCNIINKNDTKEIIRKLIFGASIAVFVFSMYNIVSVQADYYFGNREYEALGFEKPNDQNIGDVHYWDVWHGLKPFTDYRKFFFRFVSEFGFQSFPDIKTIESFTLPEDRNIFPYVYAF